MMEYCGVDKGDIDIIKKYDILKVCMTNTAIFGKDNLKFTKKTTHKIAPPKVDFLSQGVGLTKPNQNKPKRNKTFLIRFQGVGGGPLRWE